MVVKLLFLLILALSEHNFVLAIESTQMVLMSSVTLPTIQRSIVEARIVIMEHAQ